MSVVSLETAGGLRSKPAQTDDPRREIVIGGALAAIFFVGFVGWAAFVRLDAAVAAPGVVTVSGHRQRVQTADGGVVSALHVKEGDQVAAGQVLVEIDADQARANERSLSSRVINTQAEIARLDAERLNLSAIVPPAEFAALTGADRADADRALAAETGELTDDLKAARTRRAVLLQTIAQTSDQITGGERQMEANRKQQQLISDELDGVKTLAAKGYAPLTRVRSLERTQASLQGDDGAQRAEIARLHEAAGQARLQIVQADSERSAEIADGRRKAEAELQTLQAQLESARQQLNHAWVRAPASGAVVGLSVNTVGGVVAGGQTLMEIVPRSAALVIEAHVPSKDAESLRVAQEAQIRLVGLHLRSLPVLHAIVQRVSADALTDEKTGQSFFTATLKVPDAEMAKISQARGATELRPGLPVQVVVPTRKRSALAYWFEPLAQAMNGAFVQP